MREISKYSEKNLSLCQTAFEVRHQQLTAWFMAMPKIQSEELPEVQNKKEDYIRMNLNYGGTK